MRKRQQTERAVFAIPHTDMPTYTNQHRFKFDVQIFQRLSLQVALAATATASLPVSQAQSALSSSQMSA